MKQDIVEGNKSIHLFLLKGTISDEEYEMRSIKHLKHFEDLQYHSSWDWLMPVVEKISNLKSEGIIKRADLSDAADCIFNLHLMCDIKWAWQMVIQFIQWYQQKQVKE